MHFLILNVSPAESSWGLQKCLKMQVKWHYEIYEEFKKAEEGPKVPDKNWLLERMTGTAWSLCISCS